ncbi:succinate dehydrogenase, cytochrome b556 subunit [Rhodospirillum rubrum]|uniref:Succinate dehydrogenase cytochrome b556 subunit n=1 Tax=Rhodospirillum rubrum (strain ATCC 11170 / ATH 1.1.1 / DSM 467 / LMG 4362 / NCIMB 8255 / S1) TaxID=269796 RepID=Q2RV42_RHORT|nr:succinate dehydrogenase, cytochrome b556 subunit [Rhodospirillum rubrum]ABC22003.1 succinate dehydrogenase subunit C [Rhodospirillum rubrum ATCC 11170]AEO47715.1 succinate dehydrogenase subunit C [Rhodospirillum rubrum F11]MBK1666121.1 succinate dehydrogenase, cytochrome b556 subunit [Rhodospirillum rubrum]MBK1676880.1 succinate dehydrogenase, cytochrome b556 subunit [Rhodospirillum rubrum]MBK5953584.1 succinate dehydrogenase, cytochrome b556 subunit [Rhodospirillum rubrum]
MKTHPRPISPHLQVYKLHTKVTSMLSITFRVFGAALMVGGTFFFLLWIVAAGSGEQAFTSVQGFYGSPFGYLVLFGLTVVLFYHLCNGIRHMLWDTGFGFDMPTLRKTGAAAVGAAIVLSLLAWTVGLSAVG